MEVLPGKILSREKTEPLFPSISIPQYTDELTPHMEWLTEKKVLATRDINSNSAGETEELIEKQEKVIDQLDKKRKVRPLQRFKKKVISIPPTPIILKSIC